MRIARNTGNTFESEIEKFRLEAGFVEERNKERTKTAVHVEERLSLDSKAGECRDIVNDAVWEVRS